MKAAAQVVTELEAELAAVDKRLGRIAYDVQPGSSEAAREASRVKAYAAISLEKQVLMRRICCCIRHAPIASSTSP